MMQQQRSVEALIQSVQERKAPAPKFEAKGEDVDEWLFTVEQYYRHRIHQMNQNTSELGPIHIGPKYHVMV
jgi:hypothetical protein